MFYNYFRNYDPITGRYVESDPIGLNGGLNTYGYVGRSPLHAVDPRGQFAIVIPFLPEIGLMLNTIGIAILSLLPDNDISHNAPLVNWPQKKPGKYICTCRAQGINCDGQRAYGFGTGIGNTIAEAKAIAVKDAVSKILNSFSNIHHVACKCITPKGDKIMPHS